MSPSTAPTAIPTRSTRDPTKPPTAAPSMSPTIPTSDPTINPTLNPSVNPTDNPTTNPVIPAANPGGKDSLNDGDESGVHNDQIYMILAIIFGILYCCLLLGVISYFWRKNHKQNNEVDYNNAHVVAAGSPSIDVSDDKAAIALVNGEGEGAMAGTTSNRMTSHSGVDASVGFTSAGSNSIGQTTNGNTNYAGNTTPGDTTQRLSAYSNYGGIDGMNEDEDDQKSDVFKVQM